jgi:O-antigen/teichoic acid export membrane protein
MTQHHEKLRGPLDSSPLRILLKSMIDTCACSLRTRFAKNLFWITVGTSLGMIFGFVSNVYLARTLLPGGFGKLMFAQTWAQYLVLITDCGLTAYGIREIARQRDRLTGFVQNVVSFRLIASLFLFAAFSVGSWFFFPSYEMRLLVVSSSLMVFAGALNVEWALQGIERMNLVAVSRALTALVPLLLFLLFVRSPGDLLTVPVLRFFGALLVAVLIIRVLAVKINPLRLDVRTITAHLKASRHFYLMVLLFQVFHGVDIIVLGVFRPSEEVGLYAAAFRLIYLLEMGLGLISTAVFPILSDYVISDTRKFTVVRRAHLITSMAVGGAIVVTLLLMGDRLVLILFGKDYVGSARFLRILVVGMAAFICYGPCAQSLIAKGAERHVLLQTLGTAATNVALNLALVPRFGGMGAAMSYVVSVSVGTLWAAVLYYKKISRSDTSPEGS